MGGEIGSPRGRRSPRFAVWAVKDPGTIETPGTDLQRVQIVKGWVDAKGATHEQVFDVAGTANNGADVDPASCTPRGTGSAELCTVWSDPAFKRTERAFYYARVLENPTCRWSTRICRAAGVDPLGGNCAAEAAAAGAAFANCCVGPDQDPFLDTVVQERAWTSPIWYQPEGIARLRAAVRYGARPGTDRLALHAILGRAPKQIDPPNTAIDIRISDDDDIVALTIPAGTLQRVGPRRWVLPHRIGAVTNLSLVLDKGGAELRLATARTDLSHADRADHMVTVSLASGTYLSTYSRLWIVRGDRLKPGAG
jgi:hypothetical protein